MLDIYIPTFGRGHKLAEYKKHVESMTTNPCRVYFIVEADDPASHVGNFIINHRAKNYAGAINSAWEELHSDIFLAAADDLNFYSGWEIPALAKLPQFAVVGTNDLHNQEVARGEHATHYLVRGDYIQNPGGVIDNSAPVLHEAYSHNYTDREFIGTAKFRGVFTPCVESVVEHLHFTFGLSQMDKTYEKTRVHVNEDGQLYESRRNLWGRM